MKGELIVEGGIFHPDVGASEATQLRAIELREPIRARCLARLERKTRVEQRNDRRDGAGHDSFLQICDGIGLSGNSLVAIELGFYGDAGGSKDESNVAFGGYIATVDQWKAFKKLWSIELKREDVELFRRSQMEPPFHGAFKKKGWTKKYQVSVLKRLHRII